ncbi:hypothetical protein BpHYR1_051118 [Brachionus plicatilis]|uniref:Uncharacterized protein n=1 Tax=Brachionus plicatilis TaxID=10195 RepID=A0A3M7PGU0_BRAPC|nr:hypothetical protein BpHYR1_051118 [Brachionus plicatilis]
MPQMINHHFFIIIRKNSPSSIKVFKSKLREILLKMIQTPYDTIRIRKLKLTQKIRNFIDFYMGFLN